MRFFSTVGATSRHLLLRLAGTIAALSACSGSAQNAIWESDWTVFSPPTLGDIFFSAGFSPDGELVFIANSKDISHEDHEVIRLTASENVRWAVNIPLPYPDYVGALSLPLADGGLLVSAGNGDDIHYIAKIDPQGNVVWTRDFAADSIAVADTQHIVAGNCGVVTAFDASSGAPAWQYLPSGASPSCNISGVATDAQGGIYTAFQSGSSAGLLTFHIVKLDPSGHVLWNIVDTDNNGGSISYVAGNNVYLRTGGDVRGYRIGDGSPAFAFQGTIYQLLIAGNPAEPVVVQTNGSISRLDPATGTPRWQQQLTQPSLIFADVVADDVIIDSGDTVSRLSFATGSVIWSATLPTSVPDGNLIFFTAGAFGANTIGIAGTVDRHYPYVERLDFATGNVLDGNPFPSLRQDVQDSSFVQDATHIVAAGISRGPMSPAIQVRRLDLNTGAELWRNTQAVATNSLISGFANGQNQTIVSAAETYDPYSVSNGAGWISAFDNQNGNLHWQNIYYEFGQVNTEVSAPITDADGNVFVSYATSVPCAPFSTTLCPKRFLLKLSGSDGSELWRFDAASSQGQSALYPYAPYFVLLGSNVIVAGPFANAPGQGNRLLSGTDGSVLWSSSLISGQFAPGLVPFDNGDLLAFLTVNGSGFWAKLDPASGATIWQNPIPAPSCQNTCYLYDSLKLPGDGFLRVGEGDSHPVVQLLAGTQGASPINWNPDPPSVHVRSVVTQAVLDSAGDVWLHLRREHGSGFSMLAKLDLISGTLASQQIVDTSFEDTIAPTTYAYFLAAPENNRLPVGLYGVHTPDPTTSGNALLDTTVTAHGDLSLQVTLERHSVMAGNLARFHIAAQYTGDAPIQDVTIFAYMPWAGAEGVTCNAPTIDNCSLDMRSGNVRARVNLQPNDVVDISGTIRVLVGPESNELRAFVAGPIGLVENDTLNNLARAAISESLFADGFE